MPWHDSELHWQNWHTNVELERKHFMRILSAFKYYGCHIQRKIKSQVAQYERLSDKQQLLLPDFKKSMCNLSVCAEHNSKIIALMLCNANPDMFDGDHILLDQESEIRKVLGSTNNGTKQRFGITSNDMDKIRSTLKQFVRDWSTFGEEERKESYLPVLQEIEALLPLDKQNVGKIKVLVPGAGLGRLAWELAHRGYSCQGNEWSLYMLLPAYFVLNTCKTLHEHTLYPWVSHFSNNLSRKNQMKAITFPDVLPSDLPEGVQFSMVAGDFIEVYTESAAWDCVATVYFIDTAHNILSYLMTIWNILQPGGYWINFGPLLYHFADVPGEESIELTYDELKGAAERIGFKILKEQVSMPSKYTQDANSMLQYQYKCAFTVMQKPITHQPFDVTGEGGPFDS